MDSTPDLPSPDPVRGDAPAQGDASTDPHLPPEVADLGESPVLSDLPDDDLAAAKTVIRKASGGTPANSLGHSPAESIDRRRRDGGCV